jgi:hypothetical protein
MSAGPDPLARHMAAVARALWGEPNPMLSAPGKPRWGNKGSLAVDEEKGVWFNHETGKGGGVLDAIAVDKWLHVPEAFEWMDSIGCHVDRASFNGAKVNSTKRARAGKGRPDKEAAGDLRLCR